MVTSDNNSDNLIKKQKASHFLDTPHLQNLLHLFDYLVQSTNKIILISGAEQAGKTALVKALLQRLSQSNWCACLSGHHLTQSDSAAQSICQSFELPPNEKMGAASLTQFLDTAAKNLDSPPLRQLLIIDDAQLLDGPALEFVTQAALYSAEKNRGFRLILFAQPELETRLSGLPLPANMIYQHTINNFNREECRQLLKLYIGAQQASSGTDILSGSLLENIYQASEGLPGRVLQEYRAATEGSRNRQGKAYSNLSRWPIIAIALLLIVFTAIYLTSSEDDQTPELVDSANILHTQKIGSGRIDRRAVEQLKVINAAPQIKPISNRDADLDTPENLTQTAPILPKQEIERPNQKTEEVPPAPLAVPTKEPKPIKIVKTEKNPTKKQIFTEEEQLILALAPTDYTIQLMGSRTHDRIDQLIATVTQDEQFMRFETTHKNAPWVVLIYGHYQDRQKAVEAESKLPPELRNLNKPWIRLVVGIQEILRSRPVNPKPSVDHPTLPN